MTGTRQQTVYERRAVSQSLVDAALAPSRRGVFWIEDVTDPETFPVLTADLNADLVVVGGGYCGLWSAALAKRRHPGARVVLLEAETIGWAASGRNGGFCAASITHGEANGKARWPTEYDVLESLGRKNLDAFEADLADWQVDAQFERTGAIDVAVEEHQIDWLRESPGFMDQTEIRAEINSPIFLAGAWDGRDTAMVHPARLATGLARAATNLGVEVFTGSPVTSLEPASRRQASAPIRVRTPRAVVSAKQVILATNVFPPLLRRNRMRIVPVYDYVLMTEPLSAEQLAAIGWTNRQGIGDLANQFHYFRLTADNRILYGGYDAIYHPGRKVRPDYEERPDTYQKLANHFLVTFPQLEGITFTHRWAGAIDTCTQFCAFYGTAARNRIAYATGFTGLGVGATRFAAEVMLDLLAGEQTERTALEMVRRKPLPFPPEPFATVGIELTRRSLDAADHRQGQRNLFLRGLDAVGLGFDS